MVEAEVLPNTLARIDPAAEFMPIMQIDQAVDRYNTIVKVTKELLKEGTDFGKIPGTNNKNVLLKPGAEKLSTLFGLSPAYDLTSCVEDWSGQDHKGEPFFYYKYKCTLTRHGNFMGDAEGSCNSWEVKYRYRKGERKCPDCGKPAIFKSKRPGEGFYCWTKRDGCGAKFGESDPRIVEQEVGRVPNPDVADQVNTLQKMAQKRAFLSAVLQAVNASEFFTVDLEDFGDSSSSESASSVTRTEQQVLRDQLFLQAEKFLTSANYPADKRKIALERLVSLSTEEMQRGIEEMIAKVTAKSRQGPEQQTLEDTEKKRLLVSIRSNFGSESEITEYLASKEYEGALEDQTVEALKTIERDVSIPF